jgi:hypothetical protein
LYYLEESDDSLEFEGGDKKSSKSKSPNKSRAQSPVKGKGPTASSNANNLTGANNTLSDIKKVNKEINQNSPVRKS